MHMQRLKRVDKHVEHWIKVERYRLDRADGWPESDYREAALTDMRRALLPVAFYFTKKKQRLLWTKTLRLALWEMLVSAGIKRRHGIVGDALNPVIDLLRRNGIVQSVDVQNEEYRVFAAVGNACFTGAPVAVCGTAGPQFLRAASLNTAKLANPAQPQAVVGTATRTSILEKRP